MMISGTNNSDLVLNMIKNADLAMYMSKPNEEKLKFRELFSSILAENPALTDKMIDEGLSKNALDVTIMLSMMSSSYFIKHLSRFKLSDFTTVAQDGLLKGRSALWWLARAAYSCGPETLLDVLNSYKGQLTAADITTVMQDGPDKGISALWWLALDVNNGEPEALLDVLNQFKGQFTAADFTATAQDGTHKGKSTLCWLARAAHYGKPEPLMRVLARVTFDHQTLTNLSKKKLPKEAQSLVTANMALSALFESGSIDEQTLFSNAKVAKAAGFIDVYYHLGKYFEKMNMLNQAVCSFLQMPDDSYNLEAISREYSARFIGVAINADTSLEKLSNLETALQFALKIIDDEKRHVTLQTIARLYINQALQNGSDVGNEVIPPYLLEVMHGQIDSSWCFKVFQQLAETVQLKLSNKKLIEKLEKSKSKRALEQETRQLLAPIKELLTHFENEKRQAAEKTKKARPNEAEDHHDLCLDTNGPKEALTKMMSM